MATNPINSSDDAGLPLPMNEEARRIGPNVSQEHREILERALREVPSRLFNEVLVSMPNVGEDSDFEPNRD